MHTKITLVLALLSLAGCVHSETVKPVQPAPTTVVTPPPAQQQPSSTTIVRP